MLDSSLRAQLTVTFGDLVLEGFHELPLGSGRTSCQRSLLLFCCSQLVPSHDDHVMELVRDGVNLATTFLDVKQPTLHLKHACVGSAKVVGVHLRRRGIAREYGSWLNINFFPFSSSSPGPSRQHWTRDISSMSSLTANSRPLVVTWSWCRVVWRSAHVYAERTCL